MKSKPYPASPEYKPGTWRFWDSGPRGKTAAFVCPICGTLAMLIDHEIAPDGTVTPSVVCPTEGCDFHEFVRLEGWEVNVPLGD